MGTIESGKEQENQPAEKDAAEEVENATAEKVIERYVKAAEWKRESAESS